MGEGLLYSKSSGGLIYYGGGLLYDTGTEYGLLGIYLLLKFKIPK